MENNLENNQECSICLECIKEDKHKIWTCDHSFHKNCIQNWKKSCPNYRCNEKINSNNYTNKYTNTYFDIQYFLSWASEITYKTNEYKKIWKNRNCLINDHKISFYKPYGVIGVCHDCSIVEPFNLIL